MLREHIRDKRILEEEMDLGNLASANHQQLIVRFIMNLTAESPILCGHLQTEINVIDTPPRPGNKGRRFPDISLWKTITGKIYGDDIFRDVLLIVEVTSGAKGDCYSATVIRDIFKKTSSLQEAYIYNFAKMQWTKFKRTEDGSIVKIEDNDYSDLLCSHLDKYMERKNEYKDLEIFVGKVER